MDRSIEIQRQVRHNAADFQAYAKELNDWEAEMKEKDKFLQKPNDNQNLPPVRSKKPREPKEQKVVQKHKAQTYSCDYSNWDKFDADEACKDVDKSTSEGSEDEEDIIAESASRAEQAKQKARLAAKEKADKEKVKGNDYVKQEKWDDAIHCYTRAINLFNEDAVYYANRGLCHLKKESWFDAEVDCTASLKINPGYVKALQRRGTAYAAQAKLVEAIADLSKVVKIEPKNAQAKTQIEELQKKIMKTKSTEGSKGLDKNESVNSNRIQQKSSSQSTDIKELNKAIQLVDKILSDDDDTTDATNWSTGSCGDGAVLVYPIRKPPHLRSKKPLRRIKIEEIISHDIKRKSTHTIVHDPSTSQSESFVAQSEAENITSSPYEDNKLFDIDTKDKKDLINNIKVEEIKTEQLNESHKADNTSIKDLEDVEYKKPITRVQFYKEWDLFKNNPVKRFQLLKSISATNLSKFFGISIEQGVVTEILNLLNDKFVTSRLPVWNYLQGIAQLPRFSSMRMFMYAKDIEVIKNLFEYCKKNSEATDEEFKYLQELYELN